ncbi:hypothetical protein AAW50_03605 [Mycoplasmopsis canis]|uniref:hypothetical protein n=1 Tax=Mycoplasmopsis canis TaxID=29555 RepID=UPI000624BC61|nr:hypothetical protein [Mycoplasmopsis canis]AKF41463.1 hypothetical protein AAW50_03545 [Mycoplasmopsis canis]AKF41474.1 hypothetical protein AAW50_03605 [Mycoplasmopsis canis]
MKKIIDLTNYENFYKTPDELETLRKQLYRLANEADWNAWTDTDDDEQRAEYLDFVDVEQDENSIDYDDELSELDKKLLGSHSLKPNLTIDELMYFIEKATNKKYSFWTFATWNFKRKEFLEYPEFHAYSEIMREKYLDKKWEAIEFEIPSDDEE